MKITDIKMHVLGSKLPLPVTSFDGLFSDSGPAGEIEFTLVRVLTDEGIEGDYIVWSEIPTARPGALKEALRALKPHLVGEDPFNREKIWQRLGNFWYGQKGPAFAAIDIALWDIAGKATNLPIYKLLGACREKVKAYASGGPPLPKVEAAVDLAVKLKERGYKAMKLHPLSLEACRAVRGAVGDETVLIHDAVFSYDRQTALKVGRELEKLDFYWYEAPLPASDIEGYVELTRKLDIPVTVELFHSYAEYIRRGAVNIVRSMSDFTGGITEMKKIANLCESFGLNWEPHAYGGSLCQVANLHVILSVENCDFFELPIDKNGCEGSFDIGTEGGLRIDKDGYVHAPEKPGLGLEIDWKEVERGVEVTL